MHFHFRKTLEKGEHNHSNIETYDKTHADATELFFFSKNDFLLFFNRKGALIWGWQEQLQQQSKQGMQKLLLVQVALLTDNRKASKLQGAHLIYQVHPTGDFQAFH